MCINKFYKTIIILFIIIFIMMPNIIFADKALDDVKETIDEQNKYLYDELIDKRKEDDSPLDSIMDNVKKSDKKKPTEIDLSKVPSNLHKGSIKLALGARKYIVPLTILILLFNTFMLSAVGAKNYKNRKKYILGSVFIFILFLVVLNFPLYLLWRYSIGVEGFLNFEGFYRFVEALALFLKENSFVFFIIVFTFGIINMISAEYNYPRQVASKYLVKMSFVLLVLFNILPFVLKLAV